MNNVQHLLDTLGPPPAEVCLDWAWQLASLVEGSPSQSSASWSQVIVDESGRLSLRSRRTEPVEIGSNDESQMKSMTALIQQLLDWSESEDLLARPSTDFEAISLREHRRSIARFINATKFEIDSVDDDTPAASTATEPEEQAFQVSLDQFTSESTKLLVEPCSKESSEFLPSSGSDSRVRNHNPKQRKRSSSLVLWSGVTLGLSTVLVLSVLYWPAPQQNEDSGSRVGGVANAALGQADHHPDTLLMDSSATKKDRKKSSASGEVLLPDDATFAAQSRTTVNSESELANLQDLPEPTTLLGLASSTAENLPPASPAETLGSLASNAPSQTFSNAAADQGINNAGSSTGDAASRDSKSTDQVAPMEDVASMLADAVKAEPKVSSIEADVADSGVPKLPAQLLEVDSMLQVQEISAKIRLRQPAWQLQIASTEAFTVEPAGLQSLAEKGTVRWTLTAKELKPVKDQEPTQIMVFAQLAGRRADIKWKIAAGCADLPAIVVPLNEERLDAMLDMLQAYQQRLSAGVATIKDSIDLPGIPREQKSLMTAQRKAMENEGKLIIRARRIIADASMFVSWLDRSIEVHGILSDQIGGQSVTILQIGQPVQPKEIPSQD